MSDRELMLAVMNATPAKRRQIEDIINGKTSGEKPTRDDVELVNLSKAAKLLKLSRPTIYKLIECGKLDAVDLMGHKRIRTKSIMDYANGKR